VHPQIPVFQGIPGADNQVLAFTVQATEGLAGDKSGLYRRQGAKSDDKRRQLFRCVTVFYGPPDND